MNKCILRAAVAWVSTTLLLQFSNQCSGADEGIKNTNLVSPPQTNGISELPTSITIGDTTYESVRWVRNTPADVTIYHRTGVATIPLASLPVTLQQRFGYDAQKAADYLHREQVATRVRYASPYQTDPGVGVPENIRTYLVASSAAWKERIDSTTREISDYESYLESGRAARIVAGTPGIMLYANARVASYDSEATRNQHLQSLERTIAKYKETLRELKANSPIYLADMPAEAPRIGMIGLLGALRIQQVVGPTEAIVERASTPSYSFWITGVRTDGIADDSEVTPVDVFQVTSTKTYATAIGSTKTIYVLEPVDIHQYLIKQ